MARKLVVCCDGTWNTPRNETNVFRTYRFLRERLGSPAEVTQKDGVRSCGGRAADGSDVLLFYDQGVGTDWFSRLVGGAAGVGLSDNVRDAYHFLGQNFVPGSEIYVFGFSRRAYTARSLCGFIKAAGLALGDTVENAVQALAVDERRGPYVPTLWTQAADAASLAGQSVLQVWFPGVHSDIGGGYGDRGIGNITWDFMMRQAVRHGLVIDPAQPTPPLDLEPLPAQHESFDDTWKALSAKLKLVPEGVRAVGPKVVGPNGDALLAAGEVRLHPSLVSRFGKRCTTILSEANNLRQEGDYLPPNVQADTLPMFP